MTENERHRAIAFMRQLDDRACDRRERFPGGVATLTDTLPRVMNLNLLRVEQLAERLAVAELRAEAERIAGEADRMDGEAEMRSLVCHQSRMFRSLHRRWPYRRSHCRHDLHWLAGVPRTHRACRAAREHVRPHLPGPPRR